MLNPNLIIVIAIGLLIIPIFGKTASDAVQINLSVTAAPPAEGGGGGSTSSIPGCTDPAAVNYNSAATADDGSCQYAPLPEIVPNVSGFSAAQEGRSVRLSWRNPSPDSFVAVRIVRGADNIPVGPNDGDLIYDGAGAGAQDAGVTAGRRYYYVAFVRNAAGVYSSGALAGIFILSEDAEESSSESEPPSPDGGSPTGNGGEGPGIGGAGDPLANLPQAFAADSLTQLLKLGDFIFYQPGERRQFFQGNADINVIGRKPLAVLISSKKLPVALKVVGLTVLNPSTGKPLGTYLLKATPDGLNYAASLGSAFPDGIYPLFISIVNYQNQTIKRLAGRLLVRNGAPATPAARAAAVAAQILAPVAVTVGLASGVVQGLALADRIGSVYDLYLIFLHGWALLLRTLGLRRRAPPWGVVYDSVTKRPLDPAYVIVRKNEEDAGTAITDLDGRYGFFLPADTYSVIANKTHYQFPSKKLAGRERDELYDNLYFGGPFAVKEGETINRNIPLDPIAFDWNEFAKQTQGFFILHSRRQARRRRIFNALYVAGFLIGLYNFIFHPGKLSIAVLVLYTLAFLARYFRRRRGGRALAVKRPTGEPVPFAIVRAFIPDVNQEVKSIVADALGRFFLLTPPGRYYVTVEEKLPDETYKRVYQSPPIDLKNGILPGDLIV